jgi:hypothetical protein
MSNVSNDYSYDTSLLGFDSESVSTNKKFNRLKGVKKSDWWEVYEKDRDYKTLLTEGYIKYRSNNDEFNAIKSLKDCIFVPITIGYSANRKKCANNSVPDNDKITKDKNPGSFHFFDHGNDAYSRDEIDIKGSLALIRNDLTQFVIEDNWDKSIEYNAHRVLTFLRHLFYYSENSNQNIQVKAVTNYAYLSENYLLYNRDIIVKIENKDDISKNITIRGVDYESYCE